MAVSAIDRLVWDLADLGIGCVVYTGCRIAVTDSGDIDYARAVDMARDMAEGRRVLVAVLDAPL